MRNKTFELNITLGEQIQPFMEEQNSETRLLWEMYIQYDEIDCYRPSRIIEKITAHRYYIDEDNIRRVQIFPIGHVWSNEPNIENPHEYLGNLKVTIVGLEYEMHEQSIVYFCCGTTK